MSGPVPALPADLATGLRRLKLAEVRRLAPELLVVAKTQCWSPENFPRILVEAEVAARDASNARARLKAAGFPTKKTLEEFDLVVSSVEKRTVDYLATLEWIGAKENACFVGPAGTGKPHLLVALGHVAVDAERRVGYFTAAGLLETLYPGLADNSVGKVIAQTLRADLVLVDDIGFAPSTPPSPSCSSGVGPPRNGRDSHKHTLVERRRCRGAATERVHDARPIPSFSPRRQIAFSRFEAIGLAALGAP